MSEDPIIPTQQKMKDNTRKVVGKLLVTSSVKYMKTIEKNITFKTFTSSRLFFMVLDILLSL